MSVNSSFKFKCPACGTRTQRLPAFKSLERVLIVKCKECRSIIESDIGWLRYILLMAHTYIFAGLLGSAFIIGLVTGNVLQVLISGLLFALLALLPAIILHSRFLVVQKPEENVRLLDQKYGKYRR
jgi:hypothetical protein